ncbi:hypothetical protein UlMin_043141 [Ulmus minor]
MEFLNILLLVILLVAGLFNLFFYFPTKKNLFSWFQSFFPSSNSTTSVTSSSSSSVQSNRKKDELRKLFSTFDKNSDGFITKQELRDSLKNIRIFMTEKEVEETVTKLDSNGDGLIDFEEFGLLCESMIGKEESDGKDEKVAEDDEEELKEAFGVFDKDKDGLISVDELGSILCSLGLMEGKKIENCKEMIKKVDMDGDGMVNFVEFKKMMRSGGRLLLAS